MKKVFILMVVLLLPMFATKAFAYDIAVKNADGVTIFYNWINNKTELAVSSSGWGCYSGNIIIPESVEYEGKKYSVTCIEGYAFKVCSLSSITIPSSIKIICEEAFDECSVTSVHITDLSAWCRCKMDFSDSNPNPLSRAHHLFLNGKEIKDLVIPEDVTSISNNVFYGCSGLISVTIPNSVTSIGNYAFSGCSGLYSITIPNSVTSIGSDAFSNTGWYNNQPDGLVYAGKVAYKYKGTMPDNSSITIQDGTVGIAGSAFFFCSGMVSVTIPNSVTSIGGGAFWGCSGLTSVNLPSSVTSIESAVFYHCYGLKSVNIPNSATSIGDYAFWECNIASVIIPNSVTSIGENAFGDGNLMQSIVSEIMNPFEISENTFNGINYAYSTLIVPSGTKSLYQSTAGWNKFQNIVEYSSDEVNYTFNGVTYEGTKSTKSVEVKSVDQDLMSVEIPATVSYDGMIYQVTGVADNAFDGSSMAALIWNVEKVLPNNALSNAAIGSNFLLYVKSASYAPSTVKNVVVNGSASSVLLSDDGGKFYCPEQFKANSISYTHYYSMETGGNGKGWETLALPFDVQKISHSTRGEIIPFAAYKSGLSQKPFWLANFTVSGFRRSSAIMANEPYIIAMPNSSNYNNNYNLAGGVTFSSEDIIIPKTPTFNGTFLPAFTTVPKASNVYALNVNNRNVTYSGTYDAGSRFISNLRDVRPFEAYMTSSSSTRSVIEINFDDGMTDIDDIQLTADEDQEITIHTLSGQEVARTILRDFDQIWNSLPMGVYIVNGKKWIK